MSSSSADMAMEGVHYREAGAPEGMRLYALGDIHGCLDPMTAMHARIMEQILRDRPADWRIVYVGDYVDRGPDSRGVLEFLARTCREESRVIALAGNHDVSFLDFLAGSDNGLFLGNGGETTARSYGVELDTGSVETRKAGRAALREAVPADHVEFLRGLRFSVTFGDFFFCHAGIRPGVPLHRQSQDDLVWIRREFHTYRGLHPKVIVHGHTPVAEPEVLANRINIDTGGCFSGTLTALMVEGRRKELMRVTAADV